MIKTYICKENYARHYKEFEKDKTKYKAPFENSFLAHTMPVLAALPIIRNKEKLISAAGIIEAIKNAPDTIDTPSGFMDKNNMYWLMKYLAEVPKSSFSTISQVKDPTYGKMTPLVMYAFKLHHNIGYEQWSKAEIDKPFLYLFMGNALAPLVDLDENEFIEFMSVGDFFSLDLKNERSRHLRYATGKNAGQCAALTTYKISSKNKRACIRITHINENMESELVLPEIAIQMILQLWIAHSSVRNVNSMILDPFNWGNVPSALDEVNKVNDSWGLDSDTPPWA